MCSWIVIIQFSSMILKILFLHHSKGTDDIRKYFPISIGLQKWFKCVMLFINFFRICDWFHICSCNCWILLSCGNHHCFKSAQITFRSENRNYKSWRGNYWYMDGSHWKFWKRPSIWCHYGVDLYCFAAFNEGK